MMTTNTHSTYSQTKSRLKITRNVKNLRNMKNMKYRTLGNSRYCIMVVYTHVCQISSSVTPSEHLYPFGTNLLTLFTRSCVLRNWMKKHEVTVASNFNLSSAKSNQLLVMAINSV